MSVTVDHHQNKKILSLNMSNLQNRCQKFESRSTLNSYLNPFAKFVDRDPLLEVAPTISDNVQNSA